MRILYVSADYGVPILGSKGASVHVRELVKAFQALEHEVTLVTPRTGNGGINELCGHLRGIQIPKLEQEVIDSLKRVRSEMPGKNTLFKEIRSLLTNRIILEQIEAIHQTTAVDLLYERYSLWNFSTAEAARALNIPYVLEVNAPLILEQERYRSIYLKSLSQSIEKVLFEAADIIIAVSSGVKKYITGTGVPSTKIHMIPNSVDTSLFDPRNTIAAELMREQLAIPAGKTVVGFLGSLKKWHGIELLINAMKVLWSNTTEYHLLIVGNGPLWDWMEKIMREEGYQHNITMAGEIPYKEIPSYIHVMDIAVAPYLPEPDFYFSPLKIYEYMAMGKPIIASGLGQIKDVIHDGETGLLCEPGDSDDLAQKIDQMAKDQILREKTAAQSRELVIRRGDWKRNAALIVDLVEEVCPTDKRKTAMQG